MPNNQLPMILRMVALLGACYAGTGAAATTSPTGGISDPSGTTPPVADNAARACTDADLSSTSIARVKDGMNAVEVQAVMICAGSQQEDAKDAFGNTIGQWLWRSTNRSLLVKFRNGVKYDQVRYGLADTPNQQNPATYDADAQTLLVPSMLVSGVIYTNLLLSMPAGQQWQLLSFADALGNPIKVAPAKPTASVYQTGAIPNYAGVSEGTLFYIGSNLWQGMAGCAFTASQSKDGMGPTSVNATIFNISGVYTLTIQGSASTCQVRQLI